MRPTTDSERIRFRKEAGSRYRLVHEGTLEGSSNLSCVVRLVEEEMGVKLERKGYVGHGGHSSQTLQSQEPIDTRAFAGKIRRLLRLPLSFARASFSDQKTESLGLRDSTNEPTLSP